MKLPQVDRRGLLVGAAAMTAASPFDLTTVYAQGTKSCASA